MSASNAKQGFWSRLLAPFRAPERKLALGPAHLRSMSPEDAARLMGPGSVPPRAVKPAVAVAHPVELIGAPNICGPSDQPVELKPAELPWPLLRTTGIFDSERAKSDRALVFSTADILAMLGDEDRPALPFEAAAVKAPSRNLAGQLAVVARLNQPSARAAKTHPALATAGKASKTSATVKGAVYRGIARGHALNALTSHDSKLRPQAVIIDLASVKKLHRIEKSKRAA